MLSILSVHNFYQQAGGEDRVFTSEASELEERGHRVIRYEDHNDRIRNGMVTGLAGVWNPVSYSRLKKLCLQYHPDVAHFHNTFPLISPSGYYAVKSLGIPVVQKLSNYRLLCPGAYMLRQGSICDDCVKCGSFRPAIRHKCYRGSRAATVAVSTMLNIHRILGTWDRAVDMYIAPSEPVRKIFVEGGLPESKIFVKPHSVRDPGVGPGGGHYALFVGRLSEEKGIRTMLRAWTQLPDIPLMIVGDGPLGGLPLPPNVQWLGRQHENQVSKLLQRAELLVMPSEWHEIGPLTVLESFACGTPVISTPLGSSGERIQNYRTGIFFTEADPRDLAIKVRWAFDHLEQLREMRIMARQEFERKYTVQQNYERLVSLYERAIDSVRCRGARE